MNRRKAPPTFEDVKIESWRDDFAGHRAGRLAGIRRAGSSAICYRRAGQRINRCQPVVRNDLRLVSFRRWPHCR